MFPRIQKNHPIVQFSDLLFNQCGLPFTVQEVRYCFGMSKMTVKDEVKSRRDYDHLIFVEFLEFIGRLADIKWKDEEGVQNHQKVYRVLESMLRVFGYRVKSPEEADQDDITSDESLDEESLVPQNDH